MEIFGAIRFDQCVLSISLTNICNQKSYTGKEMLNVYNSWKEEKAEAVNDPWLDLHQFTIYVPHPQQEYENMTLEEGLTQGYNIEVKPVEQRSKVPYDIPQGGHFVVVLKQKGLDDGFVIAATGIFIRPLGVLSLDIIVNPETSEYQPFVVKHPVIRDYPSGWEEKMTMFINKEIRDEDLPNLVRYVDQSLNQDYRPPSWREVYLSMNGFIGF